MPTATSVAPTSRRQWAAPSAASRRIRRPHFARVTLRYARGTLAVRVNDQLLISLTQLPLEAAETTRWTFGFGARTGLHHDGHRLANLTFRSGAYEFADDVAVEVTQNLEAYTSDNQRFVYLPILRVSSISVDRGPLVGATRVLVYGSNFSRASHPLCKFGDSIVNGTVREDGNARGLSMPMVCDSPAHAEGTVALEVTLNGQDYTADDHTYTFYRLQLSYGSPSGGPLSGGALLTIWAARARCRRYLPPLPLSLHPGRPHGASSLPATCLPTLPTPCAARRRACRSPGRRR